MTTSRYDDLTCLQYLCQGDNPANFTPRAFAAARALLRTSVSMRNDFVHSFMTHAAEIPNMHLVRRDVKNGKYNVEVRAVSKEIMQTHASRFADAFQAAASANNVYEVDIDAYVREIESHAQTD